MSNGEGSKRNGRRKGFTSKDKGKGRVRLRVKLGVRVRRAR